MAARLRKTVRYPSSDSSDADLDEEHQERLINTLRVADARKTALYRNAFLCIPLLALLLYTLTLFSPSASPKDRTLALLAATSMGASAWVLKYLPLDGKGEGEGESAKGKGKKAEWRVEAEKGGPVERYLVYVTAGLTWVLAVAGVVSFRAGRGGEAGREAAPAVIFGLTMLVRKQLVPLNLEELQRARYEYKGA